MAKFIVSLAGFLRNQNFSYQLVSFQVFAVLACLATIISAAPAPKAKPQFLIDAPILPVAAALPAPVVYSDFVAPYAYAYNAFGKKSFGVKETFRLHLKKPTRGHKQLPYLIYPLAR
jgi:hypothetical protein